MSITHCARKKEREIQSIKGRVLPLSHATHVSPSTCSGLCITMSVISGVSPSLCHCRHH